jgi:hypothetical protein
VNFTVLDTAARLTVLEAKVKRDAVEWWFGRRCLAVIDRERMSSWVHQQLSEVTSGELTLLHTGLGPVAEAPGVLAPSPLMPTAFLDLRDALA